MSEKLSERLWRLLNDASERCARNSNELCLLDEARNIVKRWEDAPEGVLRYDHVGGGLAQATVRSDGDDYRSHINAYPQLEGARVKLVATP